jgi:hypothetical protein
MQPTALLQLPAAAGSQHAWALSSDLAAKTVKGTGAGGVGAKASPTALYERLIALMQVRRHLASCSVMRSRGRCRWCASRQ